MEIPFSCHLENARIRDSDLNKYVRLVRGSFVVGQALWSAPACLHASQLNWSFRRLHPQVQSISIMQVTIFGHLPSLLFATLLSISYYCKTHSTHLTPIKILPFPGRAMRLINCTELYISRSFDKFTLNRILSVVRRDKNRGWCTIEISLPFCLALQSNW